MRARPWTAVWIAAAVAVGVGLRWPALDIGFVADDHIHQAMLEGAYPARRSPFDLFSPYRAEPVEFAAHRADGTLPWWTEPSFGIGVLRPLSTPLVWGEHRVVPGDTRTHTCTPSSGGPPRSRWRACSSTGSSPRPSRPSRSSSSFSTTG